MKLVNAKKKIILAVVLVSAIGVAGLQSATAGPWGGGPHKWGGPACDGNCGIYGYQRSQQFDEKSHAAFLTETVELRKSLAVKKAEKRALMLNDNPDPKKVAELTGEIFDLREQLQAKAQDKGIEKPNFGRGPGSCGCDGPGSGPRGFQR
jgi:zinc resistance-associated protein